MENFPIAAAAIESEYAFMWIVMRVQRFHHPLYGLCGIAGVTAGFIVESGRRDRLFNRQVAATHFLFIEHGLFRNVRRTLVPIWISAIELNGQDGSRADVGATPSRATAADKFKPNVKIGVLHRLKS